LRLPRRAAVVLSLLLVAACSARREPPRPFVISVPWEADTLDPHARNSVTYFAVASQFYEPLVTTDAEMQIRPCLAELWENPDLSTWIFHLRRDVVFHSGRPLRAADVVYSIDRLMRDDRLEMAGYVLYIAGVEALDPFTVRIRTARPSSVLLNKIRFIAIVPAGATSEQLRDHVDGTGPYRLAGWRPNRLVRLVRNERYWGRRPALASVEIRLNRGPAAAIADLRSGEASLIQCDSKRIETLRSAAPGFEIRLRPSIFVKYMTFDMFRARTPYCSVQPNPFLDRRVRQALDFAIDRTALVAGLSTYAVPAQQLVPPYVFGYDRRLSPTPYAPGRSRDLLREAGFPDGFSATLHVRKMFEEAAGIVREQLARVGVRLEVQVLGDPEFLGRLARRDTSMHLSRFGCLTGDISDILDNTLHSIDPARHFGIHNFNGYSNPEIDRRIEASASIQEVHRRREALLRIEDDLVADVVWIPLYFDEDAYALDRSYRWEPRNDSMILAAEISPR
jgi:peptide/nickel transport system substrate-binding protein